MAQRYTELGGAIEYAARVAEVLVENDCAVGVRLADGIEYRGDVVISAADGRNTIFNLLGGRYVNDAVRKDYETLPVAESIVQVSIGVRRDFANVPPMLDFPLDQPIDVGDRLHHRLVLKHYCFDPAMADPDQSSLSVWAEADYDYWAQLHTDEAGYTAEKQRIGQAIVSALDRRFPGLAAEVDVVDVATPVTYERYTANQRGSIHGWALGMQKMNAMMRMGMPKTLPGLSNFYRIGQWVEPAGNVQLWAASGRDVMEMICRERGRAFVTAQALVQ